MRPGLRPGLRNANGNTPGSPNTSTVPPVTDLERVGDEGLIPRTPAADPLGTLRVALAVADQQREMIAAAGDWSSLAYALSSLRSFKGDLDALVRATEDDVARLMPSKRVELPGLGAVERKKGTTRRHWESDELAHEIAMRALTDPETGEMPPLDLWEKVGRVLDELLACAPLTGSTQWRVGALKERKIDPDDWCESSPGRQTITFPSKELGK
jgi:hypothetical protein